MDDPKVVVLDISSDEDTGRVETRGGFGGDEYDWITELLDVVDKESDYSDDVMVVGEVVLNPKQRGSTVAKSIIPKVVDDDDDDCMVLDGDPDKPVAVESDNAEGDSDDLVVVSEKGQVACRDYPHPRHLCAKYPFASTPHDSHCDQCHCYVCDSLAPCILWGAGISNVDHCHATDKEELWKVRRKSLKKSGIATPPISRVPDISFTTGLLQMNQITPLSPLELNPMPQNQVCSGGTFVRPCSTSTNFGIPNIINQCRTQQSGHVPGVKAQPHSVSQELRNTCNIVNPRDRRHGVGKTGPHIISPRAVFKRTCSVGLANRFGYSSANNNYKSQYSRNPSTVITSSHNNPIKCRDFRSLMITPASNTSTSSSQPKTGSIAANAVPSQPRLSLQHMGSTFANSVSSPPHVSPPPYLGTTFANSVSSQAQLSSQSNFGNNYTDIVSYQAEVFSQLDVGSNYADAVSQSGVDSNYANSVSSQTRVFSESGVGSTYANPVSSEAQLFSQSDVGSTYANLLPCHAQLSSQSNVGSSTYANSASSQPDIYIQPVSISNGSQDVLPIGNQTQSAVDINLSWVTPTSPCNEHPQAENSQLQSVASADEFSLVTDFDSPPFSPSANYGSLEFGFESWIFGD